MLVRLISRPLMERLRRLKLLGYASHTYPAADHSRYAHALGSMHVMRLLLHQVGHALQRDKTLLPALQVFGQPKIKTFEQFVQHMLVATLLQDTGDLPYSQATARVLCPKAALRKWVANKMGVSDATAWDTKHVFTIASIFKDECFAASGLNHQFIGFLITGHFSGGEAVDQAPILRAVRHIIDGEIDADRLDYVYRDAHHTVGGRGSPQAVVDSLVSYDDAGPVFAEPGPVSEFLATRASLWTTVYFSAENRFRTILLITLLRAIMRRPNVARDFWEEESTGDLSFEAFQRLDDISLHERLRRLSDSTKHRGELDPRAQAAMDVLLGKGPEYDCLWLPCKKELEEEGKAITIPAELFFDTFADYEANHTVYAPKSIRVRAPRFQLLHKTTSPMPLEDCCGAFSGVFRQPWSALERQSSVIIFRPRGANGGHWPKVLKAVKTKAFYRALENDDPLNPLDAPPDTRSDAEFSGPAVFISFSWADVRVVKRIVAALSKRKQRYYLLLGDYQGVGDTPGSNSIRAVQEAEGVIIVLSRSYVGRFKDDPNGNIAKELFTMRDRLKEKKMGVVYLGVDKHDDLKDAPYAVLGETELPFVGSQPLATASDEKIQEAVEDALKAINEANSHGEPGSGKANNRRAGRKANHR
jgi:hypothetical protein